MSKSDYELGRVKPEDYIDGICANLNVRFNLASEMVEVARKNSWRFYGKKPTLIASAAIHRMLKRHGLDRQGEGLSDSACRLLSCDRSAVERLADKMDV